MSSFRRKFTCDQLVDASQLAVDTKCVALVLTSWPFADDAFDLDQTTAAVPSLVAFVVGTVAIAGQPAQHSASNDALNVPYSERRTETAID